MIDYEKKIAQQTLNILMKKTWNTFSLEQVLKNVKVKKLILKQNLIYLNLLANMLIIV